MVDAAAAGRDAALAELRHQLSLQQIKVAMSPAISDRLAQVFPSTWEAWEERSRRSMWKKVDQVATSGPTTWKSSAGTSWQVGFSLFAVWVLIPAADPVPAPQPAGGPEGWGGGAGGAGVRQVLRQAGGVGRG